MFAKILLSYLVSIHVFYVPIVYVYLIILYIQCVSINKLHTNCVYKKKRQKAI